jgi:hypothetical protein
LATYTLSFDEFYEVYQNRVPAVNFATLCTIGIASFIVAVPCLLMASELAPGL